MPNNFKLPGIQKMSFHDYMNNDNLIGDKPSNDIETEPFTTLNSIRTNRVFSSSPENLSMNTGDNMDLRPNVKMEEIPTSVLEKPESTTTKIAEPTAKIEKKPDILENFKKAVVGNMPLDQFVALAGALSEAIAPDTAQGRTGGALKRFATPIFQERVKRELESPEKQLARRLTEAKIANLEKADNPKTAISWFIQNNPDATTEEVAAFKKSLDSEKAGNYWRTVSDDGTVSIYKGGNLIHQSEPGIGKTKEEKLYATSEGLLPTGKAKGKEKAFAPKTATPVSWTTATKNLSLRFGKQDATGNIIVTPQLQESHRVAQKKLVELKRAGLEPLDAINKAEDYARYVEDRYFEYIEGAGIDDQGNPVSKEERKARIEKTKKAFKSKFGYIPKMKRIQ